jgi:hypothetical protein
MGTGDIADELQPEEQPVREVFTLTARPLPGGLPLTNISPLSGKSGRAASLQQAVDDMSAVLAVAASGFRLHWRFGVVERMVHDMSLVALSQTAIGM